MKLYLQSRYELTRFFFSAVEDCSVDIGIGFDISSRPTPSVFSTQVKLQNYLLEIVERISSLPNLCCAQGKTIRPQIGFRLVSKEGKRLDDFNFEEVSSEVVSKVLALQTREDLAFNGPLLSSFIEKFQSSRATAKVRKHKWKYTYFHYICPVNNIQLSMLTNTVH